MKCFLQSHIFKINNYYLYIFIAIVFVFVFFSSKTHNPYVTTVACTLLLILGVVNFILYKNQITKLRKNSEQYLKSSLPPVTEKWIFNSTSSELKKNQKVDDAGLTLAIKKLAKDMIYAIIYRSDEFNNIILLETINSKGESNYDLFLPHISGANIKINDNIKIKQLLYLNNKYIFKTLKQNNSFQQDKLIGYILNGVVTENRRNFRFSL